MTNTQYTLKAITAHNGKYTYPDLNYTNAKTKITIKCPTHGNFDQHPSKHMGGDGCPHCGGSMRGNKNNFEERGVSTHGKYYDYSKVVWVNNKTKVEIICPIHGSFWQIPVNHYRKGCKSCSLSKGELEISKFLKSKGVKFLHNSTLSDYGVPDFLVKEYNCIIEYDGEQHYKGMRYAKDPIKTLSEIIKRDEEKNKYCLANNIKLIRIAYNITYDGEQLLSHIVNNDISGILNLWGEKFDGNKKTIRLCS